jgi:folylpolyglutamate synthase/dihydropteroate synthase
MEAGDAKEICGNSSLRSQPQASTSSQRSQPRASTKSEIAPQTSDIKHQTSNIPTVLVDYAHTHDALENVLLALAPVTRGELIVVFGCGGDRDRGKRPKMARVAARLAHRVYLTSDNPRTEDPEQILRDITAGLPAHKREATKVLADRAEAIAAAVASAGPNDTVLIAGKGHEDYQILGRAKRHFDDREHAAAALQDYAARIRHLSHRVSSVERIAGCEAG